jgi:hypothetical protein
MAATAGIVEARAARFSGVVVALLAVARLPRST